MILAESVPDSEFQWFSLHAGHWGIYFALAFSVLFVFTRVVEGSEKLAKYVPLVGKRLRERGRRREEASAERVTKKVMDQLEPPDVGKRITDLETRVVVLEQRDDVFHAFTVHDEQWHRSDEMERTEKGIPIKPRLNFRDFSLKHISGLRYVNGIWIKLEDID